MLTPLLLALLGTLASVSTPSLLASDPAPARYAPRLLSDRTAVDDLPELSPWSDAVQQSLAGFGGGVLGGALGTMGGAVVGAVLGSFQQDRRSEDCMICPSPSMVFAGLGGMVGLAVGVPLGTAAGVKAAAPDHAPSKSIVPAIGGSIAGLGAGFILLQAMGTTEDFGEGSTVAVAAGTLLATSSLGAVVADRIGSVPVRTTVAPWRTRDGALGLRVRTTF